MRLFKQKRDDKEMVLIPAGYFLMGSNEDIDELLRYGAALMPIEKPQRKIYLDAYYMDIYPVTNAEFARFINTTGYKAEGTKYGLWKDYAGAGKERHPVVSVSRNDMLAYCQWVNKRLPTEAEWEKASRGTNGRIWPWGNDFDLLKCNAKESEIGQTTPVDKYPKVKSPYGCYDMVGNVWEIVNDWMDFDYYKSGPTRNPEGPDFGLAPVMRGGAFSTLLANCRCAFRICPDSSTQFDRVGFRCAGSI